METDKLTSEYTLRIPEITKFELDKLDPNQKLRMNHQIRVTIARAIHDSKFDPEQYLKTE